MNSAWNMAQINLRDPVIMVLLLSSNAADTFFFLKKIGIVANLSENNARSEMDWSRILTDCKTGQDEDNSARRYGGVANFVIGV